MKKKQTNQKHQSGLTNHVLININMMDGTSNTHPSITDSHNCSHTPPLTPIDSKFLLPTTRFDPRTMSPCTRAHVDRHALRRFPHHFPKEPVYSWRTTIPCTQITQLSKRGRPPTRRLCSEFLVESGRTRHLQTRTHTQPSCPGLQGSHNPTFHTKRGQSTNNIHYSVPYSHLNAMPFLHQRLFGTRSPANAAKHIPTHSLSDISRLCTSLYT